MSGASERPLDLLRLFETLGAHGVDYLVIGGVAAQVHGHRRTTMDLDLTPRPGRENAARLTRALESLEAVPADPELRGGDLATADPERLATAAIAPPLLTNHGQLHMIREPKGARSFDEMKAAALVVEIGGTAVAIVSLDDLIAMKTASGRPVDLDDVAVLTEIERRAVEGE